MAENGSRWRRALAATSKGAFGRLAAVIGASEIDPIAWDNLESLLLQADVGIKAATEVIGALKQQVRGRGLTRADELRAALRVELRNRLRPAPVLRWSSHPAVILIVGVNGSGKTTTIAKLAKYFQHEGKSVLLGAADTFRAGAVDQLKIWAQQLGVGVIAGAPQSDPGAVAFSTVQAAQARAVDVALIDTAGRLQTRFNLMEELKKIHRVVGKAMPGAPHAVWLVLDATVGQNALEQARAFTEAVNVDGVILAKLDSSARGGMAIAVQAELGLPILFAGLGERVEDLQPFDADSFVDALLA
jgi:fused signal recognition particle receptor